MFKILFLLLLLFAIQRLVKKEKKPIKITTMIYFSLLSIIFMWGSIYISAAYQLSTARLMAVLPDISTG